MSDPQMADLGKQALVDLLNNLTQAKQFVLDQAPDVCQQYVALGRVQSIVMLIAAMTAATAAALWWRYCMRRVEANRDDMDTVPWALGAAFGGFAGVIGCVVSCASAYDALAAWVAPKVFLIEAISHLVK